MRNLKAFMRNTGLSQSELARRLGVTQPTVWGWLNGRSWPTPDNLVNLAEETGLTIEALLDRPARRRRAA